MLFEITSFLKKQPDDIAVNNHVLVHVRAAQKKLLNIMKTGYWLFKGCKYVRDLLNKIRYYAGIELGVGYINLPADDMFSFVVLFNDTVLHPDQRLDLVGYKTDGWHPIVIMVAEKGPRRGSGKRPCGPRIPYQADGAR